MSRARLVTHSSMEMSVVFIQRPVCVIRNDVHALLEVVEVGRTCVGRTCVARSELHWLGSVNGELTSIGGNELIPYGFGAW